jgi:hypothetical protein
VGEGQNIMNSNKQIITITITVPSGVTVSMEQSESEQVDYEQWAKRWCRDVGDFVNKGFVNHHHLDAVWSNTAIYKLTGALRRAATFPRRMDSRETNLHDTHPANTYPTFESALPDIISGKLRIRLVGKKSIEAIKKIYELQ